MNATFDTRLKNGLFPEMPASFSRSVHTALKKAGVQPKVSRPFTIAAAAISVAAVAASLVLVLASARMQSKRHEVAPDETAQAGSPLPYAPSESDWKGNTKFLAALDPDGRFSAEDADAFARSILSFLHTYGEPEPEELWILRMPRMHLTLAQDDTAVYAAPILVLAQSSFEDEDGPDLYCISAHADVGVLWGTVGSAKYPNRVSVSMDGQFVNVLYGTNAILGEPPLSHITRGAITNDDRSSDVEFSACLSSADKQAAFGSSAHFDPACDAFLVQLAEPSALDRLLRLETEDGVYSVDIRTGVFEQSVVTAAEAALHRQELDRLAAQAQSSPAAECETLNLTTLSGETAARYLDVLSTTLQSHDIHPRRIWLEGVMQFAYPQDAPADDAYLLAQYEFEGETGPELFCYKNGAIAWMTRGFDPYCLNTVYDPIGNQSVAFGHSYCYDSSAISMREGHLSLSDGTVIDFQAELPLNEVLLRVGLGSPYFASAREAFLCLYGGDAAAVSVETVAGDGHIFFPQREPEVNVLTVIPLEQPAGNN